MTGQESHPTIFLIIGDDPLLVDGAVSKVIQGGSDLSVTEYGAGDEVTKILESLRTASLMGGTRFVVIRDFDELPADGQRLLISHLEDPSPDTVAVLVAKKTTQKLTAVARKHGRVVEAIRGKRQDVLAWLRDEVRKAGLKADTQAMSRLVEAVGDERLALANALEELALSLGRGGRLTIAEVERHFKERADVRVFSFVDAVATRQAGPALESLHRLLRQGEAAQGLFWMLARHVRLMLQAGSSAAEAAGRLGIPEWRAEKIVRQSRFFTERELVDALGAIAEADRKMKNSEEPDELALERVVVQIAARPSAG